MIMYRKFKFIDSSGRKMFSRSIVDNYLADETSEGVCIERIRSRSLWPEICSIDQILKYYIAVVKSGVIEYVLKNVRLIGQK